MAVAEAGNVSVNIHGAVLDFRVAGRHHGAQELLTPGFPVQVVEDQLHPGIAVVNNTAAETCDAGYTGHHALVVQAYISVHGHVIKGAVLGISGQNRGKAVGFPFRFFTEEASITENRPAKQVSYSFLLPSTVIRLSSPTRVTVRL